jgi:hypothetical protein
MSRFLRIGTGLTIAAVLALSLTACGKSPKEQVMASCEQGEGLGEGMSKEDCTCIVDGLEKALPEDLSNKVFTAIAENPKNEDAALNTLTRAEQLTVGTAMMQVGLGCAMGADAE